ncbi:hypothetical protein [Streptomyces sp. CHB9.2]|uniref:hypothetical protein n=1 Tax=Streptomyces sp. CHB9.2 TaxID=2841670 RepID=UPI0020958F3A|nr:hypothetical protein [Streptomyces sp. CHB9.2]MCO6704892.1 hypothetical protein [Streptomyces sp. CHB9.2]
MSDTLDPTLLHQKRFQKLIEDLTGRVGRCLSRDLDQASLLDPVKTKMIGAIQEYARKHALDLPQQFKDETRLVTWEIQNLTNCYKVFTSVGHFVLYKEGYENIVHDPNWHKHRLRR